MNKNKLQSAAKIKTEKLFTTASAKAEKKPNQTMQKKAPKKVYSFRATSENIDKWKLYLSISGKKADELWAIALNEYIQHHPLHGPAKDLFEHKINS